MRPIVKIDDVDSILVGILRHGKHVTAVDTKLLICTLEWVARIRRREVEKVNELVLGTCQAGVFFSLIVLSKVMIVPNGYRWYLWLGYWAKLGIILVFFCLVVRPSLVIHGSMCVQI